MTLHKSRPRAHCSKPSVKRPPIIQVLKTVRGRNCNRKTTCGSCQDLLRQLSQLACNSQEGSKVRMAQGSAREHAIATIRTPGLKSAAKQKSGSENKWGSRRKIGRGGASDSFRFERFELAELWRGRGALLHTWYRSGSCSRLGGQATAWRS